MRPMLTVVMTLSLASVPSLSFAGIGDISPAFRERAEAICRDDALRLCAETIPDEEAIIACMQPKRQLLTLPCRRIFDEVMQDVRR